MAATAARAAMVAALAMAATAAPLGAATEDRVRATAAMAATVATQDSFGEHRLVYEYYVEENLAGVLIGFELPADVDIPGRVVFLEHVLTAPGAPVWSLVELLVHGEQRMWEKGFDHIALYVAKKKPSLQRLALRFGFVESRDSEDGAGTYYIKSKETCRGEAERSSVAEADRRPGDA